MSFDLTRKKYEYNFLINDRVSFLDFEDWNLPPNKRKLKRFYGKVITVGKNQWVYGGVTIQPDIPIKINDGNKTVLTQFSGRKLDFDLEEKI